MFQLKPLSPKGVTAALQKVERYRLLNEPKEAESICLDILEIEPDNQKALVMLILALTDQFDKGGSGPVRQAGELIPRLESEYERFYYAGIIEERQAKASLKSSYPGRHYQAYEWFREAMAYYEKAEAVRPPDNDDAILRWNTCARIIMDRKLEARPEDSFNPLLE